MQSNRSRPLRVVAKTLSVSLFALAAFSGKSFADPILSIDYRVAGGSIFGTVSGPTQFAGLTTEGTYTNNWNDVEGLTATSGVLVDNSGASTGITSTLSATGSWFTGGFVTDNALMMRTFAKNSTGSTVNGVGFATGGDFVTSTLNNLAPSSSGTTYDLFAYYSQSDTDTSPEINLAVSSGAANQYIYAKANLYSVDDSPNPTNNGVFIQGTETNYANARTDSNWAKFTGLTANGSNQISLQVNDNGKGQQVGLSGVQLVSHEPTWVGNGSSDWNVGGNSNFRQGAVSTTFSSNWYARFDDTASSFTVNPSNGGSAISVGRITVDNTANDYTFTAGDALTGSAALYKNGSGSLTINGNNNTFTGDVYINNGSVNVTSVGGSAQEAPTVPGAAGALGSGDNIHLGDGTHVGTLNYNAANGSNEAVFRGLFTEPGASGVVNIANDATLGLRYYVNNGTIEKKGAGTLLFRGGNAGGGTYNVTAGTLAIVSADTNGGNRGSGTVTINVSSGATYKTSDEHGGATVNIGTGGTFATVSSVPFLSTEFHDNAGLHLDSGSTLSYDLNGSGSSGSIKFDASSAFTFNTALTLQLVSSTSIDPTGMSFLLIDGADGGASVDLTSLAITFDYAGTGWSGGTLTYNGGTDNDLVLTGVVPEPTTFVTLLGGIGALLGFRRIGRRKA